MSIMDPRIILIKELNNMFYKFILEDKPDKIYRKTFLGCMYKRRIKYSRSCLLYQGFKNILSSLVK